MPEQTEEVSVHLTNRKVGFTGVSKSHPEYTIPFDYKPPVGDGQGFNGLELLLLSLSGCSATSVVFLLRKMGKSVTGLRVNATGFRTEPPAIRFRKIALEFIVESGDVRDDDVQKTLLLAEQSVCPVWQMVKNNVEIVSAYRITAPPASDTPGD